MTTTKSNGEATPTENSLALLTPLAIKEADLHQLVKDYGTLVVTNENIKEVDAARKKLKGMRRDIEKPIEDNVKALNAKVKKEIADYKAIGDKLVAIIKPTEDRLDREQSALEEKAKAEAKAKIEKEEKRKRDHRDRITSIEVATGSIRAGKTDAELEEISMDYSLYRDSFEEFNEEGNAVIDACLLAITNRKAFLSDLEASKAKDEQTPAENKKEPLNREQTLIELGFVKNNLTWVKGDAQIPDSMLMVNDEAWVAMLKPHATNPGTGISHNQGSSLHTKGGGVFSKMADKTIVVENLNTFQIGEYTFGLSKNVPMAKASVIRKLVKTELEKQ